MRSGLRLPVTLALAVVAGLLACTSSQDATDPNAPMNLALFLTPTAVQIPVSDTITSSDNAQLLLTATSLGFPVITPHAEWTSSNRSVAIVDSTGFVQAIGLGAATITARVNGETANSQVTVVRRVVAATLTPQTFQGLVGDTITLTATATDSHGSAVAGTAFAFSTTDPTSVNVTRTGDQTAKITLLKAGTASVGVIAGGQNASTAVTTFSRDFSGSIATSAPPGGLVLSAGQDATCGIIALGRAYCFGAENLVGVAKDTSCFGGSGSPAQPCTLIPLRIAGGLSFTSVSVGTTVACGIASTNLAYCWGSNSVGQLGNGLSSQGTSLQPNLVVGAVSFSAVNFVRVTAGNVHACGLTTSGKAFCWGGDNLFQLGTGDTVSANSTTPIPIKSSLSFTQISAGGDHTCAISTSGLTACWGDNSRGQVGVGTLADLVVDSPVTIGNFAQISAGFSHTCALTTAGAAFCWGANEAGQLGNGTLTDSPSPVAVSGGQTFRSISAGVESTCGITTAGAAFCWGNNNLGQVGNGSASPTVPILPVPVPTAVTGGHTDFVVVTVGARHACALAAAGAYCWGSNLFGALGNELQAMVQTTPTKTATPQ